MTKLQLQWTDQKEKPTRNRIGLLSVTRLPWLSLSYLTFTLDLQRAFSSKQRLWATSVWRPVAESASSSNDIATSSGGAGAGATAASVYANNFMVFA